MAEAARRVVRAGPETVVLISPHTPRRRGAFAIWAGKRVSGSLAQFGAPAAAVDLPADEILAGMIGEEAGSRGVGIWWLRDAELDHGAVVPLWHLAVAGWRGPTVLIGLNYPGEPGLAELGEAIAAAARRAGRRVALVASGDMSHRLQPGAPAGFHPRAKEFDSRVHRMFASRGLSQAAGLRSRVAGSGGGRRGGLHARGGIGGQLERRRPRGVELRRTLRRRLRRCNPASITSGERVGQHPRDWRPRKRCYRNWKRAFAGRAALD